MRISALALLVPGLAAPLHSQEVSPRRPVATYSIVARDPTTGEMGVAVQSHWFAVGPLVAWGEAGVGVVATQAFVDPHYGPLGLALMRLGRSGPQALQALLSVDAESDGRQVAMLDAQGQVDAFTGSRAVAAAGHHVGAQYAVQANLMEKASVWPAMARAYETGQGDLAERLLLALEAAEREGGDLRGKQSALILIVGPEHTGRPWADRIVDLRVEDHPHPLPELRRLVTLSRVYRKLNEGDEWVTQGDMQRAVEAYGQALTLAPDAATNGEAAFWTGISLIATGQPAQGITYLRRAQAVHPKWVELVPRLAEAKLLPEDPELIARVVRVMRR